ncbi:acyl-homoserine-lactone acylase [Altererythrobacter xiamenensis]|uniref:Acyl-homoserine-lactone acylase n=1 Tax=Altererythrobacter xiamenensis TaxID=1316679 RepID=A0A1Y6EIF0_9SPHN|nr:acylase [Altererythrobacter xiamenensis]SMQ62206.1 acyl-homoserine-lactone acylase [Altererythrobacter xiamenensis]
MTKWLGRIGFALLVLVVGAFIALATWEPFFAREGQAPDTARSYTAEIIRDDYGVPHIYGESDADVAYGVAIAHSEDDFSTLQDVAAMARGRYGAIAGQDGAAIDYVYHLLDARGTAERHYPSLPADTRALFEAYAAGLNQYAEEHPGEIKLDRLFPLDGTDIAAGFALRQPFFFGLNNVIQPLVEGKPLRREFGPDIPGFPRNANGDVIAESSDETEEVAYSPLGKDAELAGSNAFAVAPEKSGGPTVLVSNSHQPLRGQVAWYELVVESEEGWHYAGANFPGSPFPFLGHNRDLGWTNTVNRPDMVDVYKLEMDDTDERYMLDGEWRDLEVKEVTLPVRLGPITLPIRRTVYRSVHGPVIKNDQGYFAIRYGGIDNLGQLDAYYRLNKASTLEEWQTQLARMDVPSTNFIYADKAGNIAYVYNAAIPDRPAEVDGERVNWRGILPGNRSDLIWNGAVEYAEIPKLVNPSSGWLYNSNNEPYTAAGAADDLDPEDFAPELGIELKQTNRSRRAWKLLSQTEVIDRENLRRIKYDTAYAREGYVADLWDGLEALDVSDDEALSEARDLLLGWDFTADNKGPADALALLMIKEFMSAEYQNKLETPDIRASLAEHTAHLREHFGRIDPPMSNLLRLRQGEVDLPLDGGSDTLRASTTWNIDEDGRLSLVHGDSFIQWVEWLPGERVRSQSIQPFGAATTRPDSPHYTDQMKLFVEHKLKPVYFWREDVLANAKSRKVVTNAR